MSGGVTARKLGSYGILAVLALLISCANSQQPEYESPGAQSLTFTSPSWSGEGRIAFGDKGYRMIDGALAYIDSVAGIYFYTIATGVYERVLALGNYPSWAPNGKDLVYWLDYSLWIYNSETRTSRLAVSGGGLNNFARWGPCVDSFVYASTEGAPFDFTIWKFNTVVDERLQLTPEEGGLRDPVWYSGCDSLLFQTVAVENDVLRSQIYVMASSGGQRELVVWPNVDGRLLSISPNGRFISYHADGNGQTRVFVYDRQNKEYTEWSGLPGRDASWSPDGNKLVYVVQSVDMHGGINANLAICEVATGQSERLAYPP